MKFKIGLNAIAISTLLFFTGCGIPQIGSISPTVKQNTGLPLPAPHARNTDSTTRKIENAFNKSKDLQGTYIYADRAGANILLSGLVINEKQKFIASAMANSFVKQGMVINRVDIYRPNVTIEQTKTKTIQLKK